MKRVRVITGSVLLAVVLLLAGCYPDKIDYVDEYDLAGTVYDEAADFSLYTSFTVIDTIIHLAADGDDDNFSREHDDLILELLRSNMSSNGYDEIPEPDTLNPPDLLILVEAISSDYYQYWGYYWDYWSWYPGWNMWYPGYPWYPSYPWYPGYVTSYSTGTLLIEMFDSATYDPDDNTIEAVWAGVVDGLLSSNKSNTAARLNKQINQLFIQSPYLDKN